MRDWRGRLIVLLGSGRGGGRATWLTLVGLVATSIILAVIGLRQLPDQDPTVDLDWMTTAFSVLGVFSVAGEQVPVPLPLAIARLIAPITGVAVVIAGVITLCRTWLIRRLARRARGLRVLLGPTELVDSWIDPTHTDHVTLHLDTGPAGADRADARVAVQLQPFRYVPDRWESADLRSPADWVEAGNGPAATRLVVATGRDDQTVDAIGVALARGVPADGASLDAEIHNLSLALRLATELAVSDPDRQINVVCRNDVIADRAVEAILDQGDAPDDDRITRLRRVRIAVVGDDPLCRLVARRLEQEIFDGTATDTSSRFDLHVVSSDPEDRNWYRHGLQHPELFRVTEHQHLRELLAQPARPEETATAIVAFVAHRDPQDTMREAFEIVASGAAHRAVAPLGAIATPGVDAARRLISLDRHDRLNAAVLAGPFRRAAAELARRSSTDDERRTLERRIRFAVQRLVRHDSHGTTWTVEPTTFAGPGATALPRLVRPPHDGRSSGPVAVGELLTSGDEALSPDELDGLPSALADAGLSIVAHRPGVARPVPRALSERSDWSASNRTEVDDDQVERMAAELHERYRTAAMNAGRPAAVPWKDLADHHRSQNHHAVRFTIEQLRRYGLEVRRAGDLSATESLLIVEPGQMDLAVVEAMAIEEHDRWARQKRASGFVFGVPEPTEVSGSPLVNASLVDWDDLDDEDRERDRSPIRTIPEVLALVDLVIVDRRDG